MNPRIEEIRTALAANLEETKRLAVSLSSDDLKRRAANGWTLGQLAKHVAISPGDDVWLTSRLRNGRDANVPAFLSFIPAMRNWMSLRGASSITPDELDRLADDAHKKLIACVDTLKDDELDKSGVIFGMGRNSVYEFLSKSVSGHAEEHRAEIRAAKQ